MINFTETFSTRGFEGNRVSIYIYVVQPFLGKVLTERLGKIVNLPIDLTVGFYLSTVNTICQVGGVISKVTGGGSVSDQINMVIKHPLTIVANAWNTTKQELKDFSEASLGKDLTEQLGSLLSSPSNTISSVISSLTNGQLSITLKSLVDTPIMYLQKIWSKTTMTIRGITVGVIGEKWTDKISDVLNSPGQFITDSISSITGGGSVTDQIKSVLTQPLQTIKNIGNTVMNKTEGLVTSITGGGSLSEQISTVFTEPVTLVKNIWSTTTKTIKSASKTLIGDTLTDGIGRAFTSPIQTLTNLTASITGGGSLGTQIKTVLTKPFDIVKNVWDTTKSTTMSLTKTLLGDDARNSITSLFASPLESISKLYNSIVSKVSGLFGSFGASISISADASGEGGGGVTGAIISIIRSPLDVLKGTFSGLGTAEKSIIGGIKAIFHSIPIIGRGSVKIEVKDGNKKSGVSIGAGAKGETQSSGGGGLKAGGGVKTKN